MILDAVFTEEQSFNADFGTLFKGDKGDKGDKGEVDYTLVANALKGNAIGSVIALTDISPFVNVLEVKARSKNSYPRHKKQTSFGVAMTIEVDGTVVLNGTATSSGNFNITNLICRKTGTYYLCDFAEGTFPALAHLRTGITNTTTNELAYTQQEGASNQVASIKMTEGDIFNVRIQVRSGHKYENCTLKPTLYFEESPTTYTPYVDVSTASVKRHGKNLFDESIFQALFGSLPKTSFEENETEYIIQNKNIIKNYISNIRFKEKTQYVFRYTAKQTSGNPRFQIKYTDGSYTDKQLTTEYGEMVLTSIANKTIERIAATYGGGDGYIHIQKGSIQLEEGVSATEYEPFESETYTPNVDGTVEGVTPIFPTTTLITDTSGVVLDVEYNRDINKAFAELTNAILSLGGNI